MTAIQDLDASISALTDSVSAELAALTTALTWVGQDAAIEASVAKLNALNDALKSSLTVSSVVSPAPVAVEPAPVVDPLQAPVEPAPVDPAAPVPTA